MFKTTNKAAILAQCGKKAFQKIYGNLENTRATYVLKEEKQILFGGRKAWVDVEADEVDLGKELLPEVPDKAQGAALFREGAHELCCCTSCAQN